MKKILIALDLGPAAEIIARKGFELAKAMDAQPILLSVVDDPFDYDFTFEIQENIGTAAKFKNIKALEENAKAFLSALAAQFDAHNIIVIIGEGGKAETILAMGQREKADLIVMGSHRFDISGRPLISYTASEVLEKSKIPLLAVPIINSNVHSN